MKKCVGLCNDECSSETLALALRLCNCVSDIFQTLDDSILQGTSHFHTSFDDLDLNVMEDNLEKIMKVIFFSFGSESTKHFSFFLLFYLLAC